MKTTYTLRLRLFYLHIMWGERTLINLTPTLTLKWTVEQKGQS